MSTLKPADQHHLRAAEGWLELSNPDEARAELEQIPDRWLNHPDVLLSLIHISEPTRQAEIT